MKAELNIDIQEFARAAAAVIVSEIRPILAKNRPAEDDAILSVADLSKYLKVSPQWVYQRIYQQEIPHIKVGKFARFKKSAIDKWLDTLKVSAMQPLSSGAGIIGHIRHRR